MCLHAETAVTARRMEQFEVMALQEWDAASTSRTAAGAISGCDTKSAARNAGAVALSSADEVK
jgi:hypothetical protein